MDKKDSYRPGEYPEIDALLAAILKLDIRLSLSAYTNLMRSHSLCTIDIVIGSFVAKLVVEDEYGDGKDPANPALLLHLVLQSLEVFEESSDILSWSKEFGLEPGHPQTLSFYRQWDRSALKLREILGDQIQTISDWDYQMNTTVTTVLRNLVIKKQ